MSFPFNKKKARKFVSKIEPTIKRLPPFLKTPITHKNQSLVKWANGSEILSESASPRAGRGDSLSLLVLDEAAHYLSDNMIRGIVSAASPTLSRTGGDMIIISTPNGTSGAGAWYYEQVNQLQIVGNTQTEKLVTIDWWEIPDLEEIPPFKGFNDKLETAIQRNYFHNLSVRKETCEFFDSITEQWRDNEWLKKQYDDLGSILFKQEILHSFVVSEDQVFSNEVLERIKKQVQNKKPIQENKLGNNQVNGLLIFKFPIPGHRYILGVDIGKGTSKDYSAVQVFDVDHHEQVAEFQARIGTKLFGRLVKKIARYYNQGYVVIECNGIGEAVFNEVYKSDCDPYDNVFKRKITRNGLTVVTGWDTNVKTRKLMTNSLIDWLTVDSMWAEMTLCSQRLYQELTTWVWIGDRPDHADGAHDDLIIALGLALYMRNKADTFGDSFLLTEDNQFIEAKNSHDIQVNENDLPIELSEEKEEDFFVQKYHCTKEQYQWLLS
jgi:hypothetical protein